MKLEQFKEIADENLRDLTVDERMVTRVRRSICAAPVKRAPRASRASAFIAAACAVVMLLSGGVLLHGMGGTPEPRGIAPDVLPSPNAGASTLSATVETSQFIDGTTLSYGVAKVGAFGEEGYAPAMATNGLYGYVNRDSVWVVAAMYDEAQEVVDGKAAVTLQGVAQIIDLP